jgi:ubiquitin
MAAPQQHSCSTSSCNVVAAMCFIGEDVEAAIIENTTGEESEHKKAKRGYRRREGQQDTGLPCAQSSSCAAKMH